MTPMDKRGSESFDVHRFQVKTRVVNPRIGFLLWSCPCSPGRFILGHIVKLKHDNDFTFSSPCLRLNITFPLNHRKSEINHNQHGEQFLYDS
jgi:hypothetical protein